MKRWNGWGSEDVDYPLSPLAVKFIRERLGEGAVTADASLSEVVDAVPESRLPDFEFLQIDALTRLNHSRGQSLPDWIALRSGRIGPVCDGVAFPDSAQDVRTILTEAARLGAVVIPYGGGTSVVGHINPLDGERPVLTVDLGRLSRLVDLDEASHLAQFEAGVRGPELERQLAEHGFRLGHYPQSFEYSTLGGWVATRSSGQQSYYYGRIEDLVAGGRIEMPGGSLDLQPVPASAAGPDLRHLILGSEGRLGVITDVVVRIRELPQEESFHGVFFHNWTSGVSAVRQLSQNNAPVSMLRFSDAKETESTLVLAGNDRLAALADRALNLLRYQQERCLMIYGLTGRKGFSAPANRRVKSIVRSHGGLPLGKLIGSRWQRSRFKSPYLRNTLWELGYAVDTLETAVTWANVIPAKTAIVEALERAAQEQDLPVMVFAHLSHVYNDGASIYVTYIFPRSADSQQDLERWQAMKEEASTAIIDFQGTISHQHGVGIDHLSYLEREKGELGIRTLQELFRSADPDQMMNPGKLLPLEHRGTPE